MNTVVSDPLAQWAVKHRRHLHQYPELSGQEHETSQYIKGFLEELNIEILDFQPPSIVGYLRGTEGNKTVALRADIDALPITEEGEKSYISQRPGVAHLCGHDGHTAILLAAAKWLSENRSEIKPNVKFIFQSSEEMSPSGAEALVNQGVLDGVDAIFGLHLMQSLPKGKFGVCHGAMMAAADYFTISIKGKGGHGAAPHETVDPIYISSQIVSGLQSIVSRKVNPLSPIVISVGKIESDGTYNVIPDQAVMYGTLRTLSEETRAFALQEMRRVVEGICLGFGAEGEIDFDLGGVPLINDNQMSQFAEKVIVETFGEDVVEHIAPVMGGEDFANYLQRKKGAYIFVGMGGEMSAYPHHHPKFDIDEEMIPPSIQFFVQLVKGFA